MGIWMVNPAIGTDFGGALNISPATQEIMCNSITSGLDVGPENFRDIWLVDKLPSSLETVQARLGE